MTIKLALKGIKSHLRDYLVLFSGLMIASAVFYMFQAVATNRAFLKSNLHLNFNTVVYTSYLGSFLLGLIILVYIFYANSFLLSMRQKVYAMYMMLGARSKKIGLLIFCETLLIGTFAVAVGILLGLGLTMLVGEWIVKQLDLSFSNLNFFSTSALMITGIFFLIVFALAAFINAAKLVKKPILQLINQPETPRALKKNSILWLIESISGVGLLAIGYWTMSRIKHPPFELFTGVILCLIISLITIILGTYFSFDALFLGIVQGLRNSDRFRFKKIHSFTLGQLSFRLRDFTRLLSMVTLLFALSLGAITTGLSFNEEVINEVDTSVYYDLLLHDPKAQDLKEVAKIKMKGVSIYHYKVSDKVVWNAGDFDQNPYFGINYMKNQKEKIDGAKLLEKDSFLFNTAIMSYVPEQFRDRDIVPVSKTRYERIKGTEHEIRLYKMQNFKRDFHSLKPLVQADNKKIGSRKNLIYKMGQKYDYYQDLNGYSAGFEFIGLFLGLAFLAMLASILMFKILASAPADGLRYRRLDQLGVRRVLLKSSIAQEIGTIFLLPGILGVIHVLFGLKMFKEAQLLLNPYANLMVPFAIFFVLYVIYYLITVLIYRGIVLHKSK
ncbi:FtsX-like permease family protein [Xylocopilactobacillus apicola]|uniref:Permease n=1 Tax=Xylocopilactobacillus apicola TaxID=2932184 RepID=A0AAU9DUD9_9LACO|nr:ABC transporter permease [Xylocopilactobacillus apicola]BDR59093.1 permease [Xylocopilactobacillus apicola]